MRYLNKIIFINSAHVPYAEVKLDGNVHFIGTQGVGKSTLLRAILFFYNAEKSKLGIKTQAGQKGYDEFYLPYKNSYIIYEVTRETGTFFVVTFISNGRTAFRIVDCPFEKRFFIDENGKARHEWGQISKEIGVRVYRSNIIRGYEEFRNIIYGNSHAVDRELRRFSIMESAKYRQVPLTIQNIFLNQSLESRVIKDTIIDSMDFPNDIIDLNRYREEMKKFRQQYDDIWKWYRADKGGTIKVRKEADEVINRYASYEYARKLITELCGQIRYAIGRDTARLPLLKEKETDCGMALERQKRLLGEENEKYVAARDELKGKESILNSFLKTASEKRRKYRELGIEKIIEKMGREEELKITEQSLRAQETLLTGKNESIKAKYSALMHADAMQLKEYKLQCGGQLNELDRYYHESEGRLREEREKKEESVRQLYEQLLADLSQQLGAAYQAKNDVRLEETRIRQANPYAEEAEELERKIVDLKEQRLQLFGKAAEKQKEMEAIRNEVALKTKDLQAECERETARIEATRQTVEKEIGKLEELLEHQSGSLIEWLGENVKGWEDNIGKVLDEESVMYNQSLNPRMEPGGDSVYGLKIDLTNIQRNIKRPEDVRREKIEKEDAMASMKRDIGIRRQKLQKDIEDLERKPNAKLKQLQLEKIAVDTEYNLIPQRIDNIRREEAALAGRLSAWRNAELEKLMNKAEEIKTEIENLQKKNQELAGKRQKELEGIKKGYKKQKKEQQDSLAARKAEINKNLKEKEEAHSRKKEKLESQMDAELKGRGVDTDLLSRIRSRLRELAEEMKYIETHRPHYIGWLNDKAEYFDKEALKKEQLNQTKLKIAELQDKFSKRKSQYNDRITRYSDELRNLQEEQKRLDQGIRKAEAFMVNPSCPREVATVTPVETVKETERILEELRDQISLRLQKFEEFKSAVIRFKSNFSAQNTFNFRTEFNTDSDYTEFAADLNEFLTNDKIEKYKTKSSQMYVSLFRRMAKDVGDLSQHKADIDKTILSINRDFRENNFAGVIKEIELRAVESNDRLMQQLLNIKRFDDEHGFELDENPNLFSTGESSDRIKEQVVKLLMTLIEMLDAELKREWISLADTFKLEFKIKENDNDTSWVEKLSNVGSDGTDVLVKAMVNIMLINVFKSKVSRKFGDFRLHCMMDEIGKLHPNNVEGILKFANVRNIYLINSSPTTYNAQAYRYTYSLSKDEASNTVVKTLLTIK